MVQPGAELERRRRAGALDGHEGVPAGANLQVARAGSVIAFRARSLNNCFRSPLRCCHLLSYISVSRTHEPQH